MHRLALSGRGLLLLLGLGMPGLAASTSAAENARVFVQTGNELHATMARHSPDGRWLAACDALGGVVLWDAQGGRQFSLVHRHTGMCLGLDFTPDGRALLSSGGARNGNEVALTRWLDGHVEQIWRGHAGQVIGLAATLDGRGAWSLGEADGLWRWALGASEPVRRIGARLPDEAEGQVANASALALDASQRHAYIGRRDGSVLAVDLESPQAVPRRLAKLGEPIAALALAPDGTSLAVSLGSMLGAQRRTAALIDAADGHVLRELAAHPGPIAALTFSPDGTVLASAGQVDMQALLAGDLKGIATHEVLRLWRVADGALLGEARNSRNRNGMPFTRSAIGFAPNASDGRLRLGVAAWDEAPRLYEYDGKSLRLAHLLEGRGLAPRQILADATGARLLVTDGRPRVEGAESRLDAETARREFGRAEDWTPERRQRLDLVYGGQGWKSSAQRAGLWDLKSGRLDKVVDWQRAPPGYLGLDDQGRFVSLASLFPATTMVAPFKTNLVREATLDAEGKPSYGHFAFEPWEGAPDDIFLGVPAVPPEARDAGARKGYSAEVVGQSPGGRWQAVAGMQLGDAEKSGDGVPVARPGRLFVLERSGDGRRAHRYDIPLPGTARALAFAADERTLWLAGTLRGVEHHDDHEAWLMAIDLSDGKVTRQWRPERGLTIGVVAAHPGGDLLLSNGSPDLLVWDKRQEEPKFRVRIDGGKRNLSALALTRDGKRLASADLAGRTQVWDWPGPDAAPTPAWQRLLDAPAPHLLAFSENGKRLYAGAVDGSVRVLEARDGAEVARLIRFDDDAWISIVPEGYFAAARDGDRWVNVRVGDRVYGIDQFYDVFYRPDIVERRLAGQGIKTLIRATLDDALRRPPPTTRLEVNAAETHAGARAGLDLRVEDGGGGLGELRLLHNGKLIQVIKPPRPGDKAHAARVEAELVAGENAFTLIAFNTDGTLGTRPLSRRVEAAGTPAPARAFVLALGIDHFGLGSVTPLRYAAKDASDVARALEKSLAGLLGGQAVNVTLLNDAAATRAGLDAALDRLRRETRPDDLLLWFVASHGTLDDHARYGIVLHDWDGRAVESSLYSAADLLDAARGLRPFRQLIVLDTCHAGGVDSLIKGLYDARLSVLARNMGLHVLASANATEEALDGYQGNGLFTHTLLQGLDAARADRDGDRRIGVHELGEYARRETKRIARLLRHSQEPLLLNYGKDIVLRGEPTAPIPAP